MKITDKLPWGAPAFFFAGLVFMGIYWYTQSTVWFYTAGPLWATAGGAYLLRVFKKDRN
jgi:uncharacterized membrane protein YhhN